MITKNVIKYALLALLLLGILFVYTFYKQGPYLSLKTCSQHANTSQKCTKKPFMGIILWQVVESLSIFPTEEKCTEYLMASDYAIPVTCVSSGSFWRVEEAQLKLGTEGQLDKQEESRSLNNPQ